MKINSDFVTNSSTTSFVVIGVRMEAKDIPHEYLEKTAERNGITVESMQETPLNYIDEIIKGSDLEYSYGEPYGDDDVMVGIEYTKMGENETLGQFRQKVQDQIEMCFGINQKPGHIEVAWRDG